MAETDAVKGVLDRLPFGTGGRVSTFDELFGFRLDRLEPLLLFDGGHDRVFTHT